MKFEEVSLLNVSIPASSSSSVGDEEFGTVG